MTENWQQGGFGLYLHWPYCEAKCPYCDFNSHVARFIDHDAWRHAYLAEIDRAAKQTQGRIVNSVFFGGGTPSLMQEQTVAAVLDRIAQHWVLANDVEITLEANPSSVEADKFAGFARAGVNRVSLGVQALNDMDLKKLGRLHNAAQALKAIEIARNTFDRVSFDLIYARQDQSLGDWRQELQQALSMSPDHLSLYQLTIEEGTAFGDRFRAGKLRGLPDEDLGADLYDLTQELCSAAGLPAYEVSNHGRRGSESRHNLIYWRSGDFIGIGPGAHGRITQGQTRVATTTELAPGAWLAAARQGNAMKNCTLSPTEWASEQLLMGLRLRQPFDLERLERQTGYNPARSVVDALQVQGLLLQNGAEIMLTERGLPLLNAVLVDLIPDQ